MANDYTRKRYEEESDIDITKWCLNGNESERIPHLTRKRNRHYADPQATLRDIQPTGKFQQK